MWEFEEMHWAVPIFIWVEYKIVKPASLKFMNHCLYALSENHINNVTNAQLWQSRSMHIYFQAEDPLISGLHTPGFTDKPEVY